MGARAAALIATVLVAGAAGAAFGALKPWPYKPIVERLKPSKPDVEYTHRASLYEQLGPGRGVVMLGDSITSRNEWGEWVPGAVNRGISGDTVDGVTNRLGSAVGPETRRVYLMVGVNDLRRGATAEQVAAKYERLVRKIGSRVVVESTLYTSDAKVNAKVADLDRRLQAFCAAGECRYLDLNRTMAPQGVLRADYTVDGVHLNGCAYRAWADIIRGDR